MEVGIFEKSRRLRMARISLDIALVLLKLPGYFRSRPSIYSGRGVAGPAAT
jgi:hypothetical protein